MSLFQYGIVLYNVQHNPEPFNGDDTRTGIVVKYKNVATFMSIEQVGVNNIKYIKSFNQFNFNEFPTKYGFANNAACLPDALWLCSKMFRRSHYKLVDLRVYLMTATAAPVDRGSMEEKSMLKKAQEMQESGIQVVLLPYTDSFDIEPFYREFLSICENTEPENILWTSPAAIKHQILAGSKYPRYSKRPLTNIKLELAPGLDMSVQVFPTMRTCRPPRKGQITRDTNQPIEIKRVNVLETEEVVEVPRGDEEPTETRVEIRTRNLLPSETKRYITLGGESIEFTKEEYRNLKTISEPGIKILGFKPANSLPFTLHMRGPLFIYPNESWINGSTALFSALWQKCLDTEQIALAAFTRTRGTFPKLVALVPQEHDTVNFEDERIIKRDYYRNDGFRVSFIPYSDWLRELKLFDKESSPEEPSTEEVDLMKKLIKRLKSRDSMVSCENPKVTMLYRAIEAEVFELDPPDLFDSTAPDIAMQDQRMEKIIDQLAQTFGEDVAVVEKRKATKPAGGASKPKVAKGVAPANAIAAYKDGKLDKLSVAQLKEFLSERDVKGLSNKKKDQLIEMVTAEIEDNDLA